MQYWSLATEVSRTVTETLGTPALFIGSNVVAATLVTSHMTALVQWDADLDKKRK